VTQLRNDGRFGKIAIVGHSEGSLIGMIAGQRTASDAFVSLEGAGRKAADVLRAQLRPKLADTPDLAAANKRILSALEQGKTVDDVPQDLYSLYRPSVQPYLISWFRYDPCVEIAKLTGPVTVVQGTADIQIPVDDGKALAKAHAGAKFVLIDGMSHVLKHAAAASAESQDATVYVDPSIPIEPLVPATIVAALG
jgi:pimeloyl-ACP methyl ester carboxylesterase